VNEPKFNGKSDDENSDNSESGEDEALEDEDLNQLQDHRVFVLRLLKRVRACITNIRSIRAIIDYVKEKAKANDPPIKSNLITDLEIRWNTTFVMIHRFINYRYIIDNINSQPFKIPHLNTTQQITIGSKKFEFTNNDWSQLKDLHNALEPFFIATSIMSGKNYPSLAVGFSGELLILTLISGYSRL